MKNEKYKSPNSTLFSLRLPNDLYEKLKIVQSKYPKFTISSLIIMATIKDIQRYL